MGVQYADVIIVLIVKKEFTRNEVKLKPEDELTARTVSGQYDRWRVSRDNGAFIDIVDWADIERWQADDCAVRVRTIRPGS